ncbi:Uncharacterised protein [uncultured archaeon]|nr:Uncharacterised protein [uncultured archaeon]
MHMLDALWLAGRSGCVKNEEPVFGVHLLALALFRLSGHQVVPVDIFALLHGDLDASPLDHYYLLHAWGIGCCLVNIGLEGQRLAAPVQTISCNDHLGLGVQYPAVKAAGGKS